MLKKKMDEAICSNSNWSSSAIFDLHHTDLYVNNKANDVSRGLGKEIILETRESSAC